MDSTFYKSLSTRRSLKYNYFFSSPAAGKPVLLFAHGFPCTSYDWRYQVTFFKEKGYGLIVPDMLGYGGTDKPTDAVDYKLGLIAQDLVDILDAEKIDKAIAVGHDWGSLVVSRLTNYFPDRFIAFAFLAGGYSSPSTLKFAESYAKVTEIVGRELMGYWYFFAEDGAPELIEKNIDSFYSLVLADDPKVWISDLTPRGACKAWVEGNKKTKLASYLPENEIERQKTEILKGGLTGPLNYYRTKVFDLDLEDVQAIPQENLVIHKPVFLATALQDYVALAPMQKAAMVQRAKGPLTIKDFDTSHWIMWQEKEKLNQELLVWIQGLVL
ncbi:Epoxide hydrolase 2 [Termitomyces sp. T112]|nr:Epoxide hydrolase 2 [Termitomyces sp. T112]